MSRYRVGLVYSSSIDGEPFIAFGEGDCDAVSAAAAVRQAKTYLPGYLYTLQRQGVYPRGRLGPFTWISVEVVRIGVDYAN